MVRVEDPNDLPRQLPRAVRISTDGKLYLCAIKDVFSNRIVGYSISDRMTSQIAVDALLSAVQRRPARGLSPDLEL